MLDQLDPSQLPKHVGVIMDGNGRWAKKRLLPRFQGHRSAIKTVRMVIETCAELKLEALTLYAFSTENWQRPQHEVAVLMDLLSEYLQKELSNLNRNNIKLRISGDSSRLPKSVLKHLERTKESTSENTGMILNLAINYGSRAELVRATQQIVQDVVTGQLSVEEIDEQCISDRLYTEGISDPDLIVRTSGEQRISNFLLWQAAYAEFYFTETLWPDFSQEELYQAFHEFQQRQRRMGGI